MNDIPDALKQLTKQQDDFKPSNQINMVAGIILFWAGFLFYAAPTTYSVFEVRGNGIAKMFQNVLLAGAIGGLVSLTLKPYFLQNHKKIHYYDALSISNGILAGLVSITSGIDHYEPWAAISVAAFGTVLYVLFCLLLEVMWIDDPIEGSAVHMICGMWALIADGFFNNPLGAFYDDEDKGNFFWYQVCGMVVLFAWTSVLSITFFWVINCFNGVLVNV